MFYYLFFSIDDRASFYLMVTILIRRNIYSVIFRFKLIKCRVRVFLLMYIIIQSNCIGMDCFPSDSTQQELCVHPYNLCKPYFILYSRKSFSEKLVWYCGCVVSVSEEDLRFWRYSAQVFTGRFSVVDTIS